MSKQVYRKGYNSQVPNSNPTEQLNIISQFILNNPDGKYNQYEMEAKFGTRGIKSITKLDYDNVVKKLKSLGFYSVNELGSYSLKIQPEFLDARTGEFKNTSDFDRFRIEIEGITNIQEYCKTNNLKIINDKSHYNVKILRKMDVKQDNDSFIQSANFDDFNFRVTLKNEESISKTGKIGLEIFENWNKSKKVFRYINRVSFIHKDFSSFQIDLSIVRSSTKTQDGRGRMIQTYNIDESNVFENPEVYEIEVEVLDKARSQYKDAKMLSNGLQKIVKNVLCGLQKTNYPISYPEQKQVLQDYLKLLFENDYLKKGEKYIPKERVYPSDFIGPSLVTLELQNVAPISSSVVVPNITEPLSYCVTEKADGDRHLLFINKNGKIYLINTNMNVIYTGAVSEQEKYFNSLLDGELILHNNLHQFINVFAVFDIYYINNNDIRERPFIKTVLKEEKYFKEGCRLPLMKDLINNLNAIGITSTPSKSGIQNMIEGSKADKSPITIVAKKFYPSFKTDFDSKESKDLEKYNIFEANNYLLRRIADNLFDYEIDGLIFTPTLLGVGSNKFLEAGPKKKITWQHCFKWKPSEATLTFPKSYNTIDFLVITKKGPEGSDIVTPIFENGINVYESTQYNQFKTLVLAVGFDQSKHGYINPCQDVLDDKFLKKDVLDDDEEGYKPKQFFPSDPYDPLAGLCNIMLEMDSNGSYQMFTEERQVFEDLMVVEFRYDMSKTGLWKWIPMRVRYDKTADFRAKQGVGANDYNTANSNWHSIHNPVTEKMIATGQDIPGIEVSDDVYYNSVTSDTLTRGLRDFHNLFVKKALIQGVSKRDNILIDFACGKGGDFPKWIGANLSFVFGIDISKDNIENRLNGACARFLSFKKTMKNMPYALFVNGNSALNIRSGTNMFNDKANEITKCIFGSNSSNNLGVAVKRQENVGINGFDVSSCQFAIHYMFENKKIFYNFIRNVAECTKLNGYFIATSYDGKTIFNILKKKKQGESKEIYIDDKKVWSVTKDYVDDIFEDNDSSLGYKISVYQDSINQTLPEYLVNFDFLTSTMDKYGFKLITREEAKYMGLPEGSGMFQELYNQMKSEIKRDPRKEKDYKDAPFMRQYEKDISFLNRYFVYKKVSTRNAEKLTRTLLDQLPEEIEFEKVGTMMARESVKEAEELLKPKVKKLSKKIQLQEQNETIPDEVKKPKKTRTKKNIVLEINE